MFGERWDRIMAERGTQAALHLADGKGVTFQQLDADARAIKPAGGLILAQGTFLTSCGRCWPAFSTAFQFSWSKRTASAAFRLFRCLRARP